MIPIRDEIPTKRFPIITYTLIGINILVFLFQIMLGSHEEAFVQQMAVIPAHFTNGISLGDITDIFTSMFMHGGLMHIGGNMLYLWIFGDNVEDSMGSFRFLVFYLLGGVIASFTHILTNPASPIPTIGASGAIAAVLGAYLVLYPHSKVHTLVPTGYSMRITAIPAIAVLGLWFVLQFFNGMFSLGSGNTGGVAVWAHIGGFVAGVLLAKVFVNRQRHELQPRW